MSFPSTFENEESLYDFLKSRGASLRKPDPVLKLRPYIPKPDLPEMYRGSTTNYPYVIQAPESNPNYVWVGNRDDFTGSWNRIGDPITQDAVGRTTYSHIGGDQTFQPQHHNVNLPVESSLSQEQLQNKLGNLNLPTEGDRSTLFKRMINAHESPDLMMKLQEGGQPTELELADTVNRHEPINLQQTARLRELRKNQGNIPQINQGPSQENSNWWQQSNLNPSNWRAQNNNPMRLDGSQVSNAEAAPLREWGQQNLENQLNNTSTLNRLGTGSNPMTINNMPGATSALSGAGGSQLARTASQGAATGAGGAGSFLSRAMPTISLVLLANAMMQNSRAGMQRKEQNEQEQRMQT